ncbi:MAG: BatA domain-containing protein [Anaerolineae bacterium]|nr:BatA domain-containing protein [Anaerolineae bacterium]
MSFLAPLALILSALAIPIIILYMLRLRRREVQVSSIFLWQQIVRDREANAPWQKLRRNLLLLLQLLILFALVLSLARPYIEVPTVTTGRIALLIDASASMNATDVSPSRFEVAKQQAYNIIDTLTPTDTLALIRVAGAPEMIENYTNDWVQLRDAISRLEPSKATADWNAALTLAAAGAAGSDKFTIILVSDGGLPADLASSYGEVRFIPIGTANSNVAITALSPGVDPVKGAQIYSRLTNYGSQPADVIFSLNLDGQLFKALPYTVPANGSTDVLVSNLPAEFHRVQAQISRPANSTVPDFLSLDDSAWATFDPVAQQQAIIFSPGGNRFLEEGLNSFPEWRVTTGDTTTGLPTRTFDLYVFDGWLPPQLPDANMLIIDPPSDTRLFSVGAATQQTKLTNIASDDPRVRYVRFNDVNIRQFKLITAGTWADALISAEGGPLLLAGSVDTRRIAVLSFALRDSDLPLKIAWPILLANLTTWYRQPRALSLDSSVQPGQAVAIQPISESTVVRVSRPDGATSTFDVNANQPLIVYADTPMAGIYTVEVYRGSDVVQSEAFAVNLFDPEESDIAVRTPIFGSTPITAAAQEEVGQREFWPIIAVLALLILMLEWWVYHRRLQAPRIGTLPRRPFARRS